MSKVNCVTAGCEICQHANKQKRCFWDNPIYTCEFEPKNHIQVNASKCEHFICKNSCKGDLCLECEKGISNELNVE